MEAENLTNQPQKKKEGGTLAWILGLLSVLILLGTLGGVAYYYFVLKKGGASIGENRSVQVGKLVEQIKIKDGQIKILKEENILLRQKVSGVVERLRYTIKPKSTFISECYSAEIGKWNLPSQCMEELSKNISSLLKSEKKTLVLEVMGVVDEKQYAGRSPELKQEGLASFRARNVIKTIKKEFSNVAVFEGLSMQKPQKRGFAVRAYYLE